jgi:hypothetical protein
MIYDSDGYDDSDDSNMDEDKVIAAVVTVIPLIVDNLKVLPIPLRDGLPGKIYYNDLIDCNNEVRFAQVARMRKATFFMLLNKLKEVGLKDGRKVCAGEKLLIFIFTICSNTSRMTQERFQHSGDTITKVIREILKAIFQLKDEYLKLPDDGTPTSSYILNNSKFYPYFRNCIGCFDGTHISAVPPTHGRNSESFRNRKGFLSQNVLGACTFDMVFCYINAGWEGSAHDGRVLADSLTKGFSTPEGKFWLADAGYALKHWCLTPYRGVRYHLKEWRRGNHRPQNKEELFNLRHATARNVIERSCGVIKKRFPILKQMTSYPFKIQCGFVFSCNDEEIIMVQEEEVLAANEHPDQNRGLESQWRDTIAQDMWNDYLIYIENNNL